MKRPHPNHFDRILTMLETELDLAKHNRDFHQRSFPMDIQGAKSFQSRVSALADVLSKALAISAPDSEPGPERCYSVIVQDMAQCLVQEQLPPKPNNREHIWDLVIQDMTQRDADGAKKYGTHLQAFNGRNPLVDAFAESHGKLLAR